MRPQPLDTAGFSTHNPHRSWSQVKLVTICFSLSSKIFQNGWLYCHMADNLKTDQQQNFATSNEMRLSHHCRIKRALKLKPSVNAFWQDSLHTCVTSACIQHPAHSRIGERRDPSPSVVPVPLLMATINSQQPFEWHRSRFKVVS